MEKGRIVGVRDHGSIVSMLVKMQKGFRTVYWDHRMFYNMAEEIGDLIGRRIGFGEDHRIAFLEE